MIDIIRYPSNEAELKISAIERRRPGADPALEARVQEIIGAVKAEGDAAVLRYTRRFDAPGLEEGRLRVSDEEIDAACGAVDSDFMSIIQTAIRNIEDFHRQQMRHSHFMTKPDGTFLGQIVRPVRAAGIYIPGGQGGETPLISSVLMNTIPARIAGVREEHFEQVRRLGAAVLDDRNGAGEGARVAGAEGIYPGMYFLIQTISVKQRTGNGNVKCSVAESVNSPALKPCGQQGLAAYPTLSSENKSAQPAGQLGSRLRVLQSRCFFQSWFACGRESVPSASQFSCLGV